MCVVWFEGEHRRTTVLRNTKLPKHQRVRDVMPPGKEITFNDLSQLFHLPINDVARKLGICATILKKNCRKLGIPRWPHRKIKSLERMIENLKANVEKNPNDKEEILWEIQTLEHKKKDLLTNPSVLAKAGSKPYMRGINHSKTNRQTPSVPPLVSKTGSPLVAYLPQENLPPVFETTNQPPPQIVHSIQDPAIVSRFANLEAKPKVSNLPRMNSPMMETSGAMIPGIETPTSSYDFSPRILPPPTFSALANSSPQIPYCNQLPPLRVNEEDLSPKPCLEPPWQPFPTPHTPSFHLPAHNLPLPSWFNPEKEKALQTRPE